LRFGKVVGLAAIIDTREERIAGLSWRIGRAGNARWHAQSEYAHRGRVSRILGLGSRSPNAPPRTLSALTDAARSRGAGDPLRS
jgi:hypothetical protein